MKAGCASTCSCALFWIVPHRGVLFPAASSRVGCVEPLHGSQALPIPGNRKCCQAAAPTLQRGSGRPWQCLGFGRGSQPVLQEEAWRRQGCRCCPAPTALTAETKPSKLLGCSCWGTVKFQAHSADPQFRPPCAPGCDMPAALCWCDWECVLGSQSRHWVCVLGLCCVSFVLCVLSSLESEGT